MTHQTSLAFESGMRFVANVSGHSLSIDALPEDGGSNSAPSPKRLLLVALSGCTAIDVVSILNKMRVSFSDFVIETEADLTDEHPKIYDAFRLVYKIKVDAADLDKVEKAVHLSQEKYCGVSAMYKHFAKVQYRIEFL